MQGAEMTDKEFNDWWNADKLVEINPFLKDSPAYWAWEGWNAGVVAEREECAKVCEVLDDGSYAGGDQPYGQHYAAAIRARGQE
jgi:hypothetical protein